MKNKFSILLILIIFVSCGRGSTASIEDSSTQDTPASTTENKVSSEILWGKWNGDIKVYAASDVSQETVDLTVEWVNKAIQLWGSYGPLEIWIVGNTVDGAKGLDEIWCDIRVEKDPTWNTEWDCLNGDPYDSGDGWSPFFRYPTDGGAAVSGYIRADLGYYFNALIMSSKYPGPEEEDYKTVTLHEYFHVYQAGHIFQPDIDDGDGDWRTSNRNYISAGDYVQKPWMSEGGAEYMAQYWYSMESGVRPGYLKEIMEWKASTIPDYLADGRSLREIGYDAPYQVYDIATWWIAYLVHKTSEETFRVDFYADLEPLGFEAAFEKHFKKSANSMLQEFDEWLSQPVSTLLEIIP